MCSQSRVKQFVDLKKTGATDVSAKDRAAAVSLELREWHSQFIEKGISKLMGAYGEYHQELTAIKAALTDFTNDARSQLT
eukprot:NODE_1206_length_1051_cov_42.329341_g934_i0.p4 GENE.NODE_1206_length_1051_cov_42.329341_g934_i0~~NODE_1206_length_1051_cov_42.329341_g934_i0.p4  ORF type:complete len:80 (-),score=23.54 NODE_1206_length_1051_cov_42.329341_g934_i0:570-809(-)